MGGVVQVSEAAAGQSEGSAVHAPVANGGNGAGRNGEVAADELRRSDVESTKRAPPSSSKLAWIRLRFWSIV